MAALAADRHLLFGLLALQNGLINQVQLVAAFQAWTLDKARALADHFLALGHLNEAQRAVVEALADLHVAKHGDIERSLAAIPAGRSTQKSLAQLGDPDIEGTLAQVRSRTTDQDGEADGDPDRTATYSVGSATSDGLRFRVLRPHARGGLGAVFVALDTELHREVALKQILDSHADDPISRQRFLLEAEVTGGLEHPGIVPVYGLGTYDGGRPYYAMRFIRGDSLKEAIDRFHKGQARKSDPGRRALELRKLLRRFTDVCNAIEYAHSRGVLHRDLKPGNIIVGKHGETLVVDWGLAKAIGRADPSVGEQILAPSSFGSSETLPGSALGTPAYMSPEQARGDLNRQGPRSDVYSLGATLYCLLTGKPPFDGEDIGAILRAVQDGRFERPTQLEPSLDKALEAVCLKAMAAEPRDRYATPKALADDIERWAADEPVSAWRDPLSRQFGRWGRRNRTAVTAVAVGVLAALVGTAAVLAVQTKANADLSEANIDLTAAKGREAARFGLALEAIRLFHGEVGDDLVLKDEQFKPLRDKLLRGAADFYGKLEEMLMRHPDRASRGTMGNAYFELGSLIATIGDKPAALTVHRKALAVRRDLASEPAANDEARVDVAKSLYAIGSLLRETGKMNEALTLAEEARGLLEGMPVVGPGSDGRRNLLGMVYARIASVLENTGKTAAAMSALQRSVETLTSLAGDNPTGTELRSSVARSYNDIALLQAKIGKPAQALESQHRALAVYQKLASDNPADPEFRSSEARSHSNIGILLGETGKPAESLESYRRALTIHQKLADDNPAFTEYRRRLADSHYNIGKTLWQTGQLAEALESYRRALAIRNKLVDDNPTVNEFQNRLADSHNSVGALLARTGQPADALESYRWALAIHQKLANDNPAVTEFRNSLAHTQNNIGLLLAQTGKPTEAMEAFQRAVTVKQKLVDNNPAVTEFGSALVESLNNIGFLLTDTGKPVEALKMHRHALVIQQKVADANPAVTEFQSQLAICHDEIGFLSAQTGKPAEALKSYRRALAIHEKLADDNPAVTDFRRLLAVSHHEIGNLMSQTDRPVEALESHRRALAILRKLADDNPTVPEFRNRLASAHASLADVHRTLGRIGDAREDYARSIAIREELVKANPKFTEYVVSLASSVRRLGLLSLATGDIAGAVAEARKAVALYNGLRSRSVEDCYELACCHAALAAAAGRERSQISAVDGAAEADHGMSLLRQAVAEGYRNTDAIRKEAALDLLRGRDDFRLLIMDLAMPTEPFVRDR
jgi:serine/threonine-protein kinase